MHIHHNRSRVASWHTRLRAMLVAGGGVANLARWLVENTAHPKDVFKHWSFVDHEYQIGIINSKKNNKSVQKSGQSGVSELSVRMALGIAAVEQGTTIIYTLPTANFARRFAAARVGNVIDNSPLLKSMSSAIDNLEMKKIGQSYLYLSGAQRDSQAISVPAQWLIHDEFDFSDQQVLGVYESRLGHCAPGEEHKIRFSTPTLPGVYISKMFEDGDQSYYLVKHWGCGQWVDVLPERDIVVPGTDVPLSALNAKDLETGLLEVDKAWVRCVSCGGVITQENLCSVESRQWVAKYPDREEASFRVTPLDVPRINPPNKIVKKIKEFPFIADYVNFVLGAPAASADNSVMMDVVDSRCVLPCVHPDVGATGCVMGVDVGRVSWLTVIKDLKSGPELIWLERIVQDGDNNLLNVVFERMKQFQVVRLVIDAMPDLSVPRQLVEKTHMGRVLASYFVTGQGSKDLQFFSVDEEEGTIKVMRTRMFDEFVKEINNGNFSYPREHPELATFKQHLSAIKRVRKSDVEGGEKASWVSTGDDHFAFSLLYAYVAMRSLSDFYTAQVPASLLTGGRQLIRKVRLRVV